MDEPVRLSKADCFAIKRWWVGMPPHPKNEGVNPIIVKLLASLDAQNVENHRIVEGTFKDNIAEIFAVDPNAEPPSRKSSRYEIRIPPLPPYAQLMDEQLKAAEFVGCLLTTFISWATKRSPMTPPFLLEAGGLFLVSLAIALRVCIQFGSPIYPNLYILWVATTTRFAKSTGLRTVEDVARLAFPHLLIPHESTPEALIASLAGRPPENMSSLSERDRHRIEQSLKFPAQRGLLIDEASSLLGSAKKDYMQGLTELLLQAYDVPELIERSTRSYGLLIVHRMGLSLMGATTPAAMSRYVTHDRWENGELSRFALLMPERVMDYDDSIGEYDPPAEVVSGLRQLHEMLPEPPSASSGEKPATIRASMDDAARHAFRRYRRALTTELIDDLDVRLQGSYGRFPTQAVKVALNLAVLDWSLQTQGNNPTIRIGHWARAQQIVESWRASLHRLMVSLDETADSRGQAQILVLLKSSPTGLTARDLSRSCGLRTKEIYSALNVLTESGELEVIERKPPNGGQVTKIYRAVG